MAASTGDRINVTDAIEEFTHLKRGNQRRNERYYLNRQAVKGNFRWPRDWPAHVSQVNHNLCRPIVERFATYLMGKGFTWNIDRPNSEEYRDSAEKAEKILRRLMDLSEAPLQWQEGAKLGSELGRTIYKVYKKGAPGREHACFIACQPDYFYPVFAGDDYVTGDLATVYYSYPIDIIEAKRRFGDHAYMSEDSIAENQRYDRLKERLTNEANIELDRRRIPVLEVWTPKAYLLLVGGVEIYNGPNPYVWDDTEEGFIPFVVIENIRNAGEGEGEPDIDQARLLNEHLNWVISRKEHMVLRYLTPTVVWEGAPPNYAEILSESMNGGGGIPARIGSRLSLLSYDREPAAVVQLEMTLRAAILESAGMNELALQGVTTGSVNTGPALAAQFQPIISTVEKKRLGWEAGLKRLFAMLLQVQEDIGESSVLGKVVVDEMMPSGEFPDGTLVDLSGEDIQGLRDVAINWPGVLPKDDVESARLEMEKATQGLQSIYTTMEKLGVEYPNDELRRIRMEAQDSGLQGGKVAEQMRAAQPYAKMEQDAAMQQQQMAMEAQSQGMPAPPALPPGPGGGEMAMPQGMAGEGPPPEAGMDLNAILSSMAKGSGPSLNQDEDEPVIENAAPVEGL